MRKVVEVSEEIGKDKESPETAVESKPAGVETGNGEACSGVPEVGKISRESATGARRVVSGKCGSSNGSRGSRRAGARSREDVVREERRSALPRERGWQQWRRVDDAKGKEDSAQEEHDELEA
jgi:hypothetical protein